MVPSDSSAVVNTFVIVESVCRWVSWLRWGSLAVRLLVLWWVGWSKDSGSAYECRYMFRCVRVSVRVSVGVGV